MAGAQLITAAAAQHVSAAGRAGGFAVAVVMILAGAALAFDYRGVSTWISKSTERWWSGGRVRRGFRVRGAPARPVGVMTAVVGILILAAVIFQ